MSRNGKQCYCGLVKPDEGRCAHGAAPEATPRHLKAQKRKRRTNDALASRRDAQVTRAEARAAKTLGVEAPFRYGRKYT